MKTSKRLLLPIVSACCALFLLSGCADKNSADKNTIRLATGNWPEGIAVSQLLEALIGDMGYTVKTTLADPAPIFTAVANGQQDVMIETWLPLFHQSYFDQYGAKLEVIGTWFDAAIMGFAVPTYVTIDSLEDLNDAVEKFDGKIFGIDSGSSTMNTAKKAVEAYNLNYDLIESSEPAMLAALEDAVQRKKWAIIVGWEPHTMFSHFDIKFLKDPKNAWGADQAEKIQVTARKGFSKEYPELAEFFSKMKFNSSEIASLMDVANNSTPNTQKPMIRQWIKENQALVDSWFVE
jgi:glycine betaine/proline transport system substrate-binding protein